MLADAQVSHRSHRSHQALTEVVSNGVLGSVGAVSGRCCRVEPLTCRLTSGVEEERMCRVVS
eukprot:scaffold126909_cov60-Phaeocystis_antarctica.AAC.3